MTALRPGQSPPLVRIPIFMVRSLLSGRWSGDAASTDTIAGCLAPATRPPSVARTRGSTRCGLLRGAQRAPQQVHDRRQLHGVARLRVDGLAVERASRETLLGVDQLGDLRVDRVRRDAAPRRDGLVLADAVH